MSASNQTPEYSASAIAVASVWGFSRDRLAGNWQALVLRTPKGLAYLMNLPGSYSTRLVFEGGEGVPA